MIFLRIKQIIFIFFSNT